MTARVRSAAGRARMTLKRALALSSERRAVLLREASVARWYRDGAQDTLRLQFPLRGDSLVWDVGGYEGGWTAELVERYGCRVEVFEPVDRFARTLRARFEGDDRVRVHQAALGGSERTALIELDADGSTLRGSGRGATEEVRVLDVAEQLRRTPSDVDLAMINIEGAEYELLDRLIATGGIARFKRLLVQFHPDGKSASRRMKQIQRRLSTTHELLWSYPFVWETWLRRDADDGPRTLREPDVR